MKALLVLTVLVSLASEALSQNTPKWVKTNHGGVIGALSFSSDGKYLASTGLQGSDIILWDGASGKFQQRLFVNTPKGLAAAAFLPQSHKLVLGGDSGIYAFDVDTRALEMLISGIETRVVGAIDVSSSGDTLGWVGQWRDGMEETKYFLYDRLPTRVFDSLTLYIFSHPGIGIRLPTYLISSDLRTIIYESAYHTFRIHTPTFDTTIVNDVVSQYLQPLRLAKDGSYVILIDRKTDKLDSLDLRTMHYTAGVADYEYVQPEDNSSNVRAHSEVLKMDAFADNRSWQTPEYGVYDGYIMLVKDRDTTNITGLVGGVAVHPIEPYFLAGGGDGIARYSFNGDILRLSKTGNGMGVFGLNYSPQGELSYIALADMSSDYSHNIVVGSKSYTHYMAGQSFNCFNIPRIDPAADRFALGLNFFDRSGSEAWMRCPVVTSQWTRSGSHYIYSTVSDTLVFEDRTNSLKPIVTGHRNIWSIAVSRDDLVATTGADSTIKLWSLEGQLLKTFSGHSGKINDVSFAPNGRQLVSASSDSTIRVWDIDKGEIYKYDSFPEPFTQAEVSNDGLTVIGVTNRSIVGFSAVDWASVKHSAQQERKALVAHRDGNSITVENCFDATRQSTLRVYDLLGRIVRIDEWSRGADIRVQLEGCRHQPLLITLTQDSVTASTLIL